ncbi:MAG: class I tRNA ligase family protein [Lysobacterales bacterium]
MWSPSRRWAGPPVSQRRTNAVKSLPTGRAIRCSCRARCWSPASTSSSSGRADGGYYEVLTGRVPFREVYINAIVRDAEGQKMLEVQGKHVDPLDLIDGIDLDALVNKSTASLLIPQVREKVEKRIRKDYPDGIAAIGTDALRFTFAALASYSRTINFDLKRADGYKAFCNKLWNAARFVLMNTGDGEAGTGNGKPVTVPARHPHAPQPHARRSGAALLDVHRFDLLAQALYEFVWNDYGDRFLELSKPALGSDDADAAASTCRTLLGVLDAVLRALHPVIPSSPRKSGASCAPDRRRGSRHRLWARHRGASSNYPIRARTNMSSTPSRAPKSNG